MAIHAKQAVSTQDQPFSRKTDRHNGSFCAEKAHALYRPVRQRLSTADESLLMQRLHFRYQQQVTRLYEIGSRCTHRYYVGGPSSGDVAVQRAFIPRRSATAFYTQFSRASITDDAHSLLFKMERTSENSSATAGSVTITALVTTITMQDVMVNEGMKLSFASLQLD